MSKKIIAVILAVMMLVCVLAACGGDTGTTDPGTTNPGNTDTGNTDTGNDGGTEYTDTYEIRYSGFSAKGSATNLCMEEGLKAKIEELSGGRITMTIYNAGSLTGQGTTLQGIMDGMTDAGMDIPDIYSGVYPYLNLYGSPGLYFGDWDYQQETVLEYVKAYPDQVMTDNIYVLAYQPVSQQGIMANFPLESMDQFNGLALRCTGAKLSFYESINSAAVVLGTGDVFESLRLNIIQASTNSLLACASYGFYDLVDYFTANAYDIGVGVYAFSKALYEDMDPEAQGYMDELAAYCQGTLSSADNDAQYEDALKIIMEGNPDFTITELPKECLVAMGEAAAPLLDARAAELDALGLDGTGALEWLRAHALEIE